MNKYLNPKKYFNFINNKVKACPLFSQKRRNVKKWVANKGDKVLRLNYPLDKKSIVFDLGGYKGEWAKAIYSKYKCNIYVFEPCKKFAEIIRKKFKDINKINVYQFGLGEKDKSEKLSLLDNSSSFYKESNEKEEVKIKEISSLLNEEKIENIDLMKINIEGDEYNLLEHLIKTGLIKKIENIQIQFHNFVPNAKKKMKQIQKKVKETHYLTYQYYFVFENWKKK